MPECANCANKDSSYCILCVDGSKFKMAKTFTPNYIKKNTNKNQIVWAHKQR